ncbi:acetyl-CoA carboxylase family protein [Actinomycetospora lemnae]|uniref:acetyl-CoA carboxylase n=1 Tax=Actinomycetospora lemnae TaxID=3019891 RepID=A0ABT5T1X2_9PSEU|nr:carboxyl transferase domain-containing protein [Actinomycetospora sp. DW7H6]MDD7968976.1 carboxyl transferase domain-containing protein [Actinomycetospora sp. DW7H6]
MIRLLVANRGEVALRVLATAADLGLATVAIAPADDRTTAHVAAADDAVELPGAGPAAYLDVEAVVAAATKAGADALHPGYGFLSENPALARACADAGITFVGPSPEVLELCGDKARAREHARSVGVDVLAATAPPTTPDQARTFLEGLGPGAAVMVKAVAGGGGRGMRAVHDPAALVDALDRASSEAAAAFGDPAVFVERLLPRARHVEVQVAGDGTDVVVLGDRDCSVQRRHQKLVEIAPAPGLDDDVRERLHDAARRIAAPVGLRGLATVEFLVDGATTAFLEVNPRLQVEHTVTEEVLGIDLVAAQLRLADGADLRAAGLDPVPARRGTAVQARVCTETLGADGSVTPQAGTLERFSPPTGRGVRIETHGRPGYTVSPRYDSLLAKVVVHDPAGVPATVLARAARVLRAFDVAGVATNLGVLTALLDRYRHAVVDTGFVDRHAAELADPAPLEDVPDGGDALALRAPTAGVVVAVERPAGTAVGAGATVLVLEAMKMEHVVAAPRAGTVDDVRVAVGDDVTAGTVLALLGPGDAEGAAAEDTAAADPDHVRPDLAETLERHRLTTDEARPQAVAKRRDVGRRTARENLADLLDAGSFVEYGALTVAAQRRRRAFDDLVARTPADGIVTGTGTVDGRRVAVLAYDYTVLAGTQGVLNHAKTDRLLRLALDHALPVVLFAEGGGGRPGDTDTTAVASLDVETFALFARLSGRVPSVAIVAGYCFAGNAALAGCAELIVGTRDLSLGMGGPAMIEGGGLGSVTPGDVGPASVQGPNGVLDVLVDDEAAAVDVARRYLGLCTGATAAPEPHDQRLLRHAVPENRLRVYDVRPVLTTLADPDTVLELRPEFGLGIVTALARIGGRPVGVLANDPRHLGGAIDAPAAEKAARFLQLCDARGLPVVSLCDTPGFMVGPDAERTATVRKFSRMFVAGANARVPLVCVVLRKGYGLGAMAMAGGHLHRPVITTAWPTSEFGGMGLEGAVHLGYRQELEALSGAARKARFDELVGAYYERGKGLSVASVFEVDDVIDPAATRDVVLAALDTAGDERPPRHPLVDTW